MNPGMGIDLPCYVTIYHLEPGDTLERLAEKFGYTGLDQLAALNGLSDSGLLRKAKMFALPGGHFVYARDGDTLKGIDELFGLPSGSARVISFSDRPNPQLLYHGEVIPTERRERRNRRFTK